MAQPADASSGENELKDWGTRTKKSLEAISEARKAETPNQDQRALVAATTFAIVNDDGAPQELARFARSQPYAVVPDAVIGSKVEAALGIIDSMMIILKDAGLVT